MQQVPLLASTLNKPSLSRSLQPARPAQIRTALRSVATIPAPVQASPLSSSTQLVTDLNNNHPQLLLLQSDPSLISTNGAINLNALQHDHLLLSSLTDQPLLPSLSPLTETMATSGRQSLPSIAELKQWKLNRTNNTQTQSAVGSVACNNSSSTSSHTGVPSAVVVQPSTPVIQITPSDTTALSSSIEADSLLVPSETFLLNGEQLLLASPIIVSGIHSNSVNSSINGNNCIIPTDAVGHSRQAKSMDSTTTASIITKASGPTSSVLLPAFSSLQPPCISYNEFPTELNPKFVDDEEFMFLDELDDAVGIDLYDPDCESYLTNPMIKMEDAFQVDRFQLKASPTLAELNLGESDDLFDHLGLQPPKRNGLRNWRNAGMEEEQQELLLNSSLYGPAHINGHVVGSGGSLNTSALMMLNGSALSNTNGNTSKTAVPLANSNRVLCNLLNSRPAVSINGAASDAMILGLRNQSDISTTPVNGDNVNTQLRLPNRNRPTSSRNRNSSMSTEYSFSSSHDEGFASQAEEDELDEKLDEETDRCSQETDRTSEVDSNGRTPEPTEEDANRLASSSGSGKTAKLRPTVEPTTKAKRLKVNSGSNVSSNVASNVASVQTSGSSISGGRQRLSSKCSMRSMGERSEEEGKLDGEDSSDDEDDESFYGDYEAKDLLGACTSDDLNNRWSLNMGRTRKNCAQRYFWQYNVQSKGPKGVKLTASLDNDWSYDQETASLALGASSLDTATTAAPVGTAADPVVVLDLEPLDPVFSPNCQIEGVKHAGKARRGDGNDLTPNPRKLLMIGLELKKLSKIINDLVPVAEVPAGNKPNSRKEKNKLASRACRLKKKAQHEANKIKLHGLSAEQRKLLATLSEARRLISYSNSTSSSSGSSSNGPLRMDKDALQKLRVQGGICNWLRRLQQLHGQSLSVAGNSTDFVNSVLDEVSAGNCNGGLDKL